MPMVLFLPLLIAINLSGMYRVEHLVVGRKGS